MRSSALTLLRVATRRPLLRAALVTALAVAAAALPIQAATKTPPPAVRLPAPDNLSPATSAELHGRMGRHGNTMSNLVRALVLLDRPTVTVLAGRIADEEVVARSEADGADKWKPILPKGFFTQQDALRATARDLAAAAAHGDTDTMMADRFGAVARTCVTCHSIYLHGH